jgi:DNA-binding transcriptional ArsR family regulator
LLRTDLPNPKLGSFPPTHWSALFPYYAGFTEQFAAHVIEKLALPPHSTVLDPWNGAGTTTTMAARKGLRAIGRDLNPVMPIVAQARALKVSDADILLPLAELLLSSRPTWAQPMRAANTTTSLLSAWFDDVTVRRIQEISRLIRSGTTGGIGKVRPSAKSGHLSAISAALYVSLFSAVRSFMDGFRSSNPTWLRQSADLADRLNVDGSVLDAAFLSRVADATRHALDHGMDDAARSPRLESKHASAKSHRKASLILTSPPYCTRLDYAHMTALEMGIIGLSSNEYQDIRRAMTGTSLTSHVVRRRHPVLGTETRALLERVRAHHSRASSGYYFASHLDYYNKMASALTSLSKQIHSDGTMVMVVQDSWYKDIHNDVPALLTEIAEKVGFMIEDVVSFPVKRSLADVHRHRKAYKTTRPLAESVMVFRKSRAH